MTHEYAATRICEGYAQGIIESVQILFPRGRLAEASSSKKLWVQCILALGKDVLIHNGRNSQPAEDLWVSNHDSNMFTLSEPARWESLLDPVVNATKYLIHRVCGG